MPSGGRVWQTNVPAAITQLVTLVRAQVLAMDVQVLVKDGPWTSEESQKNVICIGWPGFSPGYEYPTRSLSEELGGAATSVVTQQSGLEPAFLEAFAIECSSIARSGDRDIASARGIAYSNMSLVGAVIDDFVRSPPVAKATMAASSALHYAQTRRGIDVVVTFSIECEAWAQ